MFKFIFLSLANFFLFCSLTFSMEDALIHEEKISSLYQLGKPIQVSVIWSRLDGKFEVANDFYFKEEQGPITKIDLAKNCHVGELLSGLINGPPICPLKLNITVRLAETAISEDERISVEGVSLMARDDLVYYGFIK